MILIDSSKHYYFDLTNKVDYFVFHKIIFFFVSAFSAESFASYLSHQLGTQVPVNRPLNYFAIFMSIFFALAVLAILKLMYPIVQSLVQNKNTWTAFSLVFNFRYLHYPVKYKFNLNCLQN
jgi:hypothetical protein